MHFGYSKKHLNSILRICLIGFMYLLLSLIFNAYIIPNHISFSLIIFGIVLYYYRKKHNYLSIENDQIKTNHFLGKEIKLKEIKQIEITGNKFILITPNQKLRIDTSWVEVDSLILLKEQLNKLNVKWL